MTETETIQLAQKGNLSAFNRLVMTYQSLAYNVAYRVMGDGDYAADATQEAFIKAFKAIKQYKGGSFKSWLLRIVTNTCYDHLRYHQRRPTEALETDEAEPDVDYAPHLVDQAERPEETALRHELCDMIQEAISQLTEDQRTIVILNDVQGFSYQEISEITGLALGTVKSRLSRARRKLRDALKDQELLPQPYHLRQ